MEDIVQEDLFVVTKKEKQIIKEISESTSKTVPIGFIPVKFLSYDKMGPAVLHFRNYSMGELLELSSTTSDNEFETLIYKVLNNICFEKYDCSKLHIENIKQIMLTIYLNFWGSSLIHQPYYIDLNGNLESEENVGYTDIDIRRVLLKEISPEFKNPFTIKDEMTKIKFILPTVEHVFFAEKYVKKFYDKEFEKFRKIKNKLEIIDQLKAQGNLEAANDVEYNQEEKEAYEAFEEEKAKLYLNVIQCQLIHSVNGKELTTIEEKLEAYRTTIDAVAWQRYKETIEKYADFGIDDNYTFKVDDKELTRRFSFRAMDFLPSVDSKPNTNYTVSFDD